MKTIVEPKKYIVNLWGKQRIKETDVYRLMRYVLRVDHEGKVLLHNAVTGQLAELSREEAAMLEKLPAVYDPVMEQLAAGHFLVREGFDEYKSVHQLRRIYKSRFTGKAITHYVILPTTFCNAHCFYCYESDHPRVQMTEETAGKLIDYIDEHRQGKRISINWFGGEPLVGLRRIDQISQGLMDREIPFASAMISNGYLFDEEIVERSRELWKLQRVQITLDGTEDTYNRVKAYADVQDNPYQRVLRNIDLLSGKGIHVKIRLNADVYNQDEIRKLIEELGERYSGQSHVTVYLNTLFDGQGYQPVHHSYDDILALMDFNADCTERLKEMKLHFDDIKYPYLSFSQCMADNPHAVMIQPDGSFCRCEHESIHDRYGSLEEGVTDPGKLDRWNETMEPSDICPECPIYPACYHLRHCMNNGLPCIERFRVSALEKQKEQILSMYGNGMEADVE
ncbi:MAG: radical SAM protein [Clostridia bacterium]|nr:radical SAM protein [Clostridia bacterium]MBR6186805.1 radical SAM protein [Clostridia bacterium]